MQYDFSSITNTFWELRSRGALFNPRNLVGLLIPKVVENMLDAKAELDTVLRQAINDLTAQFVGRMMAPIKPKDGKTPAKIAPADAATRTAQLRKNIEDQTPFLRAKLDAYITDLRTREMLVAAVMESVTAVYEDWFDTTYTNALNNGAAAAARSAKGKGRQDAVWDPDVFAEWCGSVFKVGVVGLGILDEGDVFDEGGGEGSEGSGGGGSVRSGTERTGTTGIRIRM